MKLKVIIHNKRKTSPQQGFTIIELLIATAILSVILLMATAVMLNIGNLFYKGFNQSRIQDDVRSVSDNLSQQLKFYDNTTAPITNTPPNGSTPGVLCVGTTRYTYVIGKQISDTPSGSDQIQHVLWQDTLASSSTPCTPVDLTLATPTTGGSELIAPDSRLTAFCVGTYKNDTCTPTTGSPYTITIGAAYGDDDLLSATTGTDAACKGTTGDQFCATAFLGTTADARLGTVSGGGGGGGTTAASCDQPQDSYAKQHSYLYLTSDNTGPEPWYTSTDQTGPGGYHGDIIVSPAGGDAGDGFFVQSPIFCIGDLAEKRAPLDSTGRRSSTPVPATQADLVGQECGLTFNYTPNSPDGRGQSHGGAFSNNFIQKGAAGNGATGLVTTYQNTGVINSNYQCANLEDPSDITWYSETGFNSPGIVGATPAEWHIELGGSYNGGANVSGAVPDNYYPYEYSDGAELETGNNGAGLFTYQASSANGPVEVDTNSAHYSSNGYPGHGYYVNYLIVKSSVAGCTTVGYSTSCPPSTGCTSTTLPNYTVPDITCPN